MPPAFDWSDEVVIAPTFTGARTLDEVGISTIRPLINWIYFYNCWKVTADSDASHSLRLEAETLLDELEAAGATMRCRVAFYPAHPEGDAIDIAGTILPTPRQRPSALRSQHLALADFIAPRGMNDHIGCFAVTIGETLRQAASSCNGDSYRSLLLASLCDRLAEATAEWLHYQVRTSLWGYAPDEPLDLDAIKRGKYQGIRPAVGYPSLPDQSLMHTLAGLVRPEEIGIEVTENGAMSPASSIAGFMIRSPHARYFSV